MKTISTLITLISARALSILGFFILPLVMTQNGFKTYVLYFSIWQILSQLIGMQLGATLFRYGRDVKYTKTINALLYKIQRLLLWTPFVFMFAVAFNLYIFAALVMSCQFAIFNIYSDYSRAFMPENKIFRLQLFAGLLYLIITVINLLLNTLVYIQSFIIVEWLSYYILTYYLYRLISMQFEGTDSQLRNNKNIRRIFGAWKKISLPLLPNNLTWYFYFNAPQIFAYYLVSESITYNQQAILFRVVVALSTFSSTIVLAFQKKVVSIYDESLGKYIKLKKKILCFYMPCSFIAVVTLSISYKLLYKHNLIHIVLPTEYSILPNHFDVFLLLFWLFIAIYSLSHYFIAEKNMAIIAPSMIFGLIIYCSSMILGTLLNINFSEVAITALILSLTITFLLRYVWLLSYGVKKYVETNN